MAAAFVQSKSLSTDTTTATTIAATFASAVGSRNLVCGMVTWGSATITLSSVKDDKNNTYTVVQTIVDTPNTQSSATFYLQNITNGPVTVTATFSSAVGFRGILIHEVSGLQTGSPLDVNAAQNGAGSTATDGMTSGSATTKAGGDYIFGGTIDDTNTRVLPHWNAGTGFTKREESGSTTIADIASEDRIQTSAGSIAATFTQLNNADTGQIMMLSFLAARITPRSLPLLGVGS